MDKDSRVRLLTLMLYREVGGDGYQPAIDKLSKDWPDFYFRLNKAIEGIKADNATAKGYRV